MDIYNHTEQDSTSYQQSLSQRVQVHQRPTVGICMPCIYLQTDNKGYCLPVILQGLKETNKEVRQSHIPYPYIYLLIPSSSYLPLITCLSRTICMLIDDSVVQCLQYIVICLLDSQGISHVLACHLDMQMADHGTPNVSEKEDRSRD